MTSSKIDPTDPQAVWDILAERIEAFSDAWSRSAMPPAIEHFLPAEPSELRHLALVELVKVDLEQRWQHARDPRTVADYVCDWPQLADAAGRIPSDLVYEEFHVRRRLGEDLDAELFCQQFPQQADELRRLFGLAHTEGTSSLLASAPSVSLAAGDSIDDFDLLTELGKGSFATVFLARQRSMQRLVALKVTASRNAEAQTLAQLDHPHIVRVYDQRTIQDNLRLLYMQYIPGGTLSDMMSAVRTLPPDQWSGAALLTALDHVLNRRGEQPPDSVFRQQLREADWAQAICWLGLQIAAALEYAHQHGVLHRDLKPANVLLSADGSAKLFDFNISFCSKLDGATPAAYFGGSLAYMSPEQLEACNPLHEREPSSLDGRSDVYSLAVLLWEMLSGQRPFQDEMQLSDWPATLAGAACRRREPLDATLLTHGFVDCPAALAELLVRCLSSEPADRPKSAAEMARLLRLCLEPDTQSLLRPSRNLARRVILRFPLLSALTLVLLPNALAGTFNYFYNDAQIIRKLADADAQAIFWNTQLAVNAIAFPLGLLIGGIFAWPVTRRVAGQGVDVESWPQLRRRCLNLGHFAAVLGVVEWLVAGVVYPVALHLAGAALTTADYLHFMASLALCGTVAAAYPFFAITTISVRVFYPRLALPDTLKLSERVSLLRIQRLTWIYLLLAASLPMFGVALLVFLGGAQNRIALGILSAGGLVGLSLIFVLTRRIQHTLGSLADLINIANDPLHLGSESEVSSRLHR